MVVSTAQSAGDYIQQSQSSAYALSAIDQLVILFQSTAFFIHFNSNKCFWVDKVPSQTCELPL